MACRVQIKEGGAKAGVVLNPGTSLATIEEVGPESAVCLRAVWPASMHQLHQL